GHRRSIKQRKAKRTQRRLMASFASINARESGGGRTRLRRSLGLGNRLSCAPSDFGALSKTFWAIRFGIEMHIDPALLSAMSALVGALVGGTASLVAAIYTQRYQNRLQRVAREATKREQVYADFIMSSSKLLLSAYVHDGITLTGDNQHLVGLLNRMRLFAPP